MNDDDARAVLREHGHEPPKRGRLGAQWRELAAGIASGAEPGSPPPDDGGPAEDITAAAPPPVEEPAAPAAEQKPRRPRQPRTGLLGAARKAAADGKPKTKARHPRVSLERLTGALWDTIGRLASNIDLPLGRAISMGSPVAGLVFDDILKGTPADTLLQPVARSQEKAEKGAALIGPPLIVIAMQRAAGLDDEARALQMAILQPMLLECLVMQVKLMGDMADRLAEREALEAPAREKAFELMQLIFAPPQQPEPEREPEMAGA